MYPVSLRAINMEKQVMTDYLWNSRLKAAIWLAPVLIMFFVVNVIVLPWAYKIQESEQILLNARQNIFEQSWLDSVQVNLENQHSILTQFFSEIKTKIACYPSRQELTDEVRKVVLKTGVDITKIQTKLIKAAGLYKMDVKVEGNSNYKALQSLFRTIRNTYPQYVIDRMTVRKSRQGLNYTIFISIYCIES